MIVNGGSIMSEEKSENIVRPALNPVLSGNENGRLTA